MTTIGLDELLNERKRAAERKCTLKAFASYEAAKKAGAWLREIASRSRRWPAKVSTPLAASWCLMGFCAQHACLTAST